MLLEAFFRLAFWHGDMAFRQFENDLIDEQVLNSMLAPEFGYARTGTAQDLWRSMPLNTRYKAYVDAQIGNSSDGFN